MGQALTRLPRMTSGTQDLTRAVDLIKKAVDPLLQQAFGNGVLVPSLAVTAAVAFVVNHSLGRVATGALVVSSIASAMMVVRPAAAGGFSPTPDPTTQLALIPSATGTVSLWVF